jgi:hypothetical protein
VQTFIVLQCVYTLVDKKQPLQIVIVDVKSCKTDNNKQTAAPTELAVIQDIWWRGLPAVWHRWVSKRDS